jgi:hypothetical protein
MVMVVVLVVGAVGIFILFPDTVKGSREAWRVSVGRTLGMDEGCTGEEDEC